MVIGGARNFKHIGILTLANMLSSATSMVDVLDELGYNCTFDVEHCKEIFSLFSSITYFDIFLFRKILAISPWICFKS